MKERQQCKSEQDSPLNACVNQYERREWNHVSQRIINKGLDRDPKSCAESWKNYLKPGIKRGSLSEDEQQLVVNLQGKYGNRWKKIAGQVPGTTAKRLGKWWEVYRDKQDKPKDTEERSNTDSPNHKIEGVKYDDILETLAEKYMQRQKQLATPSSCNLPSIAAMPSGSSPPISLGLPTNPAPDFIQFAIPSAITPSLPPWVSNRPNSAHGFGNETLIPKSSPRVLKSSPTCSSSPSVTLSLSPSSSTPVVSNTPSASSSWLKNTRTLSNISGSSEAAKEKLYRGNSHIETPSMDLGSNSGTADQNKNIIQEMSMFLQQCRELEERQQSWLVHKKETCWRLKRLEQQLEAEKARKRREKMEEIEFKVRALREEESLYLDRLETDYKEQLSRIHRDAEIKEGRVVEMWTAKHVQLAKLFEQIAHRHDPGKSSSESH